MVKTIFYDISQIKKNIKLFGTGYYQFDWAHFLKDRIYDYICI